MMKSIVDIISLYTLPVIITAILLCAVFKKIPVYETFIEGAKDGIKVCGNIVPYLVAIIVAISMLRASGFLEFLSTHLAGVLTAIHLPPDILPLTIVRSLSGSASLGVFTDIIQNNDVNSYSAKLAAIMLGSSETTFYVLAVYFGSVGIKKFRYALFTGIFADIMGIAFAILVANFFFA